MILPFTPSSFRKLDIFQQLMEYESHRNEKHLWDGVKAVLIWAASPNHQHLGSYIDTGHVKDALKYCADEGFISEKERERLVDSCRHIAESLPVYMFGEFETEQLNSENKLVRINRDGILAGRILFETNFLKQNLLQYKFWIYMWWFVLALAFVLLLTQTTEGLKNLFSQSSTHHSQHQMQWHRHHSLAF